MTHDNKKLVLLSAFVVGYLVIMYYMREDGKKFRQNLLDEFVLAQTRTEMDR